MSKITKFLAQAGISTNIANTAKITDSKQIQLRFPLDNAGWAKLDLPSAYSYGLEYDQYQTDIVLPTNNQLHINMMRQNIAI